MDSTRFVWVLSASLVPPLNFAVNFHNPKVTTTAIKRGERARKREERGLISSYLISRDKPSMRRESGVFACHGMLATGRRVGWVPFDAIPSLNLLCCVGASYFTAASKSGIYTGWHGMGRDINTCESQIDS